MNPREIAKKIIPKPAVWTVRDGLQRIRRFGACRHLAKELQGVADYRKIFYMITPHPDLANVGDQAQAVAIHEWFRNEFPFLPVVELDKLQTLYDMPAIRPFVKSDDLIFLHSGGNMGDRGLLSEMARRKVIETFPNNRVVSLPQTIFFSDTDEGRAELAASREIYEKHSRLTIVARDGVSAELAREYFPSCPQHTCPDFVLYLDARVSPLLKDMPRGDNAVLCIRNDPESILGPPERERIRQAVDMQAVETDTTLSHSIPRNLRWKVLMDQLKLFAGSRLAVTDRFHGVIFAVLTRTPCVALPTVDHKLEAACRWFEDVDGVVFASELDDVEPLAQELAGTELTGVPDWAESHFDGLGHTLVGEDEMSER